MISLYTSSDFLPALREIISSEFRLDELVELHDLLEKRPAYNAFHILVRPKHGIAHTIDWQNALPPYLLPEEITFTPENLLALIYAKLGNWERTEQLLENNPSLLHELGYIAGLQAGMPLDANGLQSDFHPFEEYRFCHNSAIIQHYASDEADFSADRTRYFYREALHAAPSDEYAAFTLKHFAAFLTDLGELSAAEQLLQQTAPMDLTAEARQELKASLAQVWIRKLTVPYDQALLANLKNLLWEVLETYRSQNREIEEGLSLLDAARIANYAESFAESLGYSNRAIQIFQTAEIPELLAQAHHRRAMLLYTWAKNGNPQFYRSALESFKESVKVFNRENAPEVFADIQQYLGIIYAEMPDEDLKRSMWAAISNGAFQESLSFFKKESYPYEYAMVCNHYGNALTKYPPAIHSDNIEKALFYYNEALSIRTPQAFPFERAVTLLNYVEASWYLNLAGNGSNQALFNEMSVKAQEALGLTDDPTVQQEARQQLQKLAELKETLEEEKELLK